MSLRDTAIRGGAYLVGREAIGLLLRLVGVLVVTRIIGPASFGLYAGSLVGITVLAVAAQLGAEVFLVRRTLEPSKRVYDEVFTVLLQTTTLAALAGLAGSMVVAAFLESPSVLLPFQVMLFTIPLNVLWAPAQARLERGLHFRRVAGIQLGSDVALYLPAVVLAILGAGVWAPVAGTFASAAWVLLASCVLARYRPRVAFSRMRAAELVRYGAAFVPGVLLTRAEQLVNPLVVGPLLGAAAVGQVALATRLVENVGFVLRATYRVQIAAFSRVQTDPDRLRRGFEETMLLQLLVLGPILAGLTIAAPILVPLVFGSQWEPTLEVLPFAAIALLIGGFFSVHLQLLYVLGRTTATSLIAAARLTLLFGGALVLTPRLGLTGYGLAVMFASLGWVIAHFVVRTLLDFSYGNTARWMAVFSPPLFVPLVPLPWAVFLVAPAPILLLADRSARSETRAIVRTVTQTFRSRSSGSSATSG